MPNIRRLALAAAFAIAATSGLSACVYQPLYGANSYAPESVNGALSAIRVADVETRTGQQVRNHLIFLIQGGREAPQPVYELRIRVGDSNRKFAATRDVRDSTAGSVTVTVSYDLIELATMNRIAGGSRIASASYDRTGQSFANQRAVLDAENRAAREVAEQVRFAIASDLTRS